MCRHRRGRYAGRWILWEHLAALPGMRALHEYEKLLGANDFDPAILKFEVQAVGRHLKDAVEAVPLQVVAEKTDKVAADRPFPIRPQTLVGLELGDGH